jgi:heme-binding protein
MKHAFRRTLVAIPVILLAIQLVPVNRSNPPVTSEVPAPENVRAVLRVACYDCHSNETTWPWYSRVAPVSWLIARDVHQGRKELNYSEWNLLDAQRQAKKLKESRDEVVDGDMPPWYYRAIHTDATLSADDRTALRDWTLNAGPQAQGQLGK